MHLDSGVQPELPAIPAVSPGCNSVPALDEAGPKFELEMFVLKPKF
jgi:hypothetical protein